MPAWFKIEVTAEIDAIESIKALLLEHAFVPLEIRNLPPEREATGLCLIGYLPADAEAETRLDRFERALWHFQAFGICTIADPVITPVDSLNSNANNAPEVTHFSIGKTWLIKLGAPGAAAHTESQDRLQITLRQGSAFGTGLHPSTRLLLELLETLPVAKKSVLDVGTGSGILAIAGAKMGAQRVLAIDIATEALRDALTNISLNPDLPRGTIHVQSQPLDQINETFDLILANLPGNILIQKATRLSSRVKPSGQLLLSGYRTEQQRTVEDHFAASGLEKKAETSDNDWISTCWQKTKNQTAGIPDRGRPKQITRRNPF